MARRKIVTMVLLLCLGVPARAGNSNTWRKEKELEQNIAELEKRYATYEKKYEELKAKADQLRPQVANMASIVQGRITPTSGVPVTNAATTGNGTIYFTPYKGNYVSVYYRNAWRLMRFTEISLALSGTAANSTYDVFVYRGNLGTLTLELSAAWSTLFARTDALTLLDGVYVKNSDNTRRYLGTIRTVAANQYSDSEVLRGIWNYYNRTQRYMRWFETNNTWKYGTATWRQAQADTANDMSFVIGIREVLAHVRIKTNNVSSNNTAKDFSVGVGMNTITSSVAQLMGSSGDPGNQSPSQAWAEWMDYPAAGYNTASWIENGISGNNVTSWGDNGLPSIVRSGIYCIIEG